jgi:outer membrane autotransporter protein
MKRTLSLMAIVAAATMGADIKYGINAEALLAMPSIDQDGMDPVLGFGGNIGGGARIAVAEKFSVRPSVSFEYVTNGLESTDDPKVTITNSSMFLPIAVSLEYAVMPQLFVAVTPEFDLSLGGTSKYEQDAYTMSIGGYSATIPAVDEEEDIKDEDSPMLVGLGLGYNINEKIAVTAGYKLAVTEYGEKYKLNKVALGVRYEL